MSCTPDQILCVGGSGDRHSQPLSLLLLRRKWHHHHPPANYKGCLFKDERTASVHARANLVKMSTTPSADHPVPIQAISIPAAIDTMVPKPNQVAELAGTKKKQRSIRNVINNIKHGTTFEEMKERERSKSPLRRLMRNFSRSPLRRRKKNEDITVDDDDPESAPLKSHQLGAHQGDGVSSIGTADYMQNAEFMADPLGPIRPNRSHLRTEIRSSASDRSISSSTASRADSIYDSETSNSSLRESRDNDSMATGSRDSRGSKQHERPRPMKISKRRMIQERTPTPSKRASQGLPSVREDDLDAPEDSNRLESKKSEEDRYRQDRIVSRRPRKLDNSQVVWTKYPDAAERLERTTSSSVPKVQLASSSSVCSESTCLSTRVLLLLLHPVSKFFELIQLVFTPETSTLGDLLDHIPSHATEAKLADQRYIGLVRASKHAEAWTQRLQPASHMYTKNFSIPPAGIVPGDVLVAIPHGYTKRHVLRLGRQILESPRIKSLLVDKFRAEMNVPDTITTTPLSRPFPGGLEVRAKPEPNEERKSLEPQSSMERLWSKEKPDPSTTSNGRSRIATRQKTPPPSRFWNKSKNDVDKGVAVQPVSSKRIMSWDSIQAASSNEPSSSSMDDKTVSEADSTPVAGKETFTPAESPAAGENEVLSVTRSIMTDVVLDRDDSTAWKDRAGVKNDPKFLEYSRCTSENNVSSSPLEDEEVLTESDMLHSPEISASENITSVDALEGKCAIPMSEDDHESTELDLSRQTESNRPEGLAGLVESADEVKADIAMQVTSQGYLSCDPRQHSPVRRRIVELEERIAICPNVPVPKVGPHDFTHSESTDENEDLPDLVETNHAEGKYDSDSDDVCDKPGCDNRDESQIYEDAISSEAIGTSSDEPNTNAVDQYMPGLDLVESTDTDGHREILREALAHVESLPAPLPKTTPQENHNTDDDATVVTNNTAPSCAPLALGGKYEDASVDTNYSSWSHSVDSSLLSRYSLISHSNSISMCDEDRRLVEARARTRQRRRLKTKLARSLRKLGLSAFALLVGLYLIDPRRRSRANSDYTSGAVDSPLGFFGILQFVIVMSVLMKVQLLWKNAAEMKSGTCPFLKAANVFIEGVKDKHY